MSSFEPRLHEIEYVADVTLRAGYFASRPGFVLLDSCRDRGSAGRYDILAAEPRTTLVTRGPVTTIDDGRQVEHSNADPFELVARHLGPDRPAVPGMPFSGGAIGYFGYDLARRIERLPVLATRDLDVPEMVVGIYDWALVVDHERQTSHIVGYGLEPDALSRLEARLAVRETVTPAAFGSSFQVTSSVHHDMSRERYGSGFESIKRYIRDGDCYQVNFAQRFSADVRGDPWDAYQRLRQLNPAPYSAFVTGPDVTVLSSSPERFIQVRDGVVETKPIKGTRPRNPEAAEDRRLAEELGRSEKDRAENVMIVDLLRNDIGKSCVIGSVAVPKLCAIESFATVHHLVSTVRGRLRRDESAASLLRACFPGGSITGAPKVRSMEIIESLEPCRRSVYCGAIGYLSYDGAMDTNIAIRTLLCEGGRMYCWAGGGIVFDSREDDEYQESLDKAAAMLELFARSEAQYVDR